MIIIRHPFMFRSTPLLLAAVALLIPLVSRGATPSRSAPPAPPTRVAPTPPTPRAQAAAPSLAPQVQIDGAEPTIHAVRGKNVAIAVPAGFASVHLEVFTAPPKVRSVPGTKPPGPSWKTVASKLMHSQPGLVQLQVPRLTGRRYMRVSGVKPSALGGLAGGVTTFAADPTAPDGASSPTLSLGGISNSSLSLSSTASTSSADTSAPRTVTESDIWKIDGDRLYFFNSVRGLQVFNIAQPDKPTLLGTLTMPGSGEQMYLLDATHVVLLKNESFWWSWLDWDFRWNLGGSILIGSPIFLNTNASATLTLSATSQAVQSAASVVRSTASTNEPHAVVVVDVSSGAPVPLAQVPFTGYLQESRLVGKVLYVASQVYESTATYQPLQWGLRVTSVDLSDPAHPVAHSGPFVPGWASAVCATDHYFFAAVQYGSDTSVKAFDISDPHGAIVKTGDIPVTGYVADKFKMDQRGTTFTVVTSGWRQPASGFLWGPYSLVSTFSLADPQKPVALATLDGPVGEQLYATRFDGSRLYLVTAVRNWDPLEIIDLSKPEQPVVLGSLEMPGYSTFIQPLGDQLVATGLVNGQPTVDLYDVKNPAAPRLLSRVNVGSNDAYTYSEATWNEKAFNILPESNLILLPTSSYDYGGGGTSGGVQLIDLLPDRLVKRGAVQHKFYPRRAGLHGTRILSISATELLTVNADDRDHPVVTSDLDIAWPVERTFLAGPWLLELGGDTSSNSPPTLTVTAADSPGVTTTILPLPNLQIQGATLRDGVLYVLQSVPQYNYYYYWGATLSISGPVLTLSTIDVSALPSVKLLGQIKVNDTISNYNSSSERKPLWVNDHTLIFSSQYNAGWPLFYTTNTLSANVSAAAASSTLTTTSSNTLTLASSAVAIYPYWWYNYWGRWTDLFAFDVTTPSQPKLASRVTFGKDEGWEVGQPLTANNQVYLGFRVLPSSNLKLDPAAGALDPVNRYFLKLIDYKDSSAPVVEEGAVNLPGELRALGRQGSLLYTVGPLLDLANGKLDGTGRAVQASSFDGSSAHLLDELRLDSSAQPILVSGNALLVLHPQPPTTSVWDLATGQYVPNPNHTSLDTWSLNDDGKFIPGITLPLGYELSLGQVNDLGVLRNNTASVRLLDLSDPLNPVDLGFAHIHANGSSSLNHADGNAQRGLWLPLGAYGVDVIPLAPAP